MYRDITFLTGVGRACLAAGPVFVAAVALFAALDVPRPVPVDAGAWGFVLIAIPATIVGGLLAFVPNLLGAALLARMAHANVGLRLPTAWAMIGALAAGGPAAALSGGVRVVVACFAATGAICALLCRSGTTWPD